MPSTRPISSAELRRIEFGAQWHKHCGASRLAYVPTDVACTRQLHGGCQGSVFRLQGPDGGSRTNELQQRNSTVGGSLFDSASATDRYGSVLEAERQWRPRPRCRQVMQPSRIGGCKDQIPVAAERRACMIWLKNGTNNPGAGNRPSRRGRTAFRPGGRHFIRNILPVVGAEKCDTFWGGSGMIAAYLGER